jgi:hypothetical protein
MPAFRAFEFVSGLPIPLIPGENLRKFSSHVRRNSRFATTIDGEEFEGGGSFPPVSFGDVEPAARVAADLGAQLLNLRLEKAVRKNYCLQPFEPEPLSASHTVWLA